MHLYYIWYFLIGAFLCNGIPHFIWGVSNVVARSPFAEKSKPIINLRWGIANFIIAVLLSFWQITANNFSGGALIALLIGFGCMLTAFGFGIKRFIHS
jgi:ABC-type multidrug transport system permease subunit